MSGVERVGGSSSKKWVIIGGGVGALVIVAIILFLVLGGSDDSTSQASSEKRSSTTVTTIAATTTTLDPISAAKAAKPQLYDLAIRLENILDQSSKGRGQVGKTVGDVRSCSITPNTAAIEIDQVVANRRTVLSSITSLTNNAGPDGSALIGSLQSAIQNSIDADIYYASWMRYLYSRYYYTYPIGCPSGSAPTNSDYDMAVEASGRASASKQQFVDLFNPIAESFGLTTWDPGTI